MATDPQYSNEAAYKHAQTVSGTTAANNKQRQTMYTSHVAGQEVAEERERKLKMAVRDLLDSCVEHNVEYHHVTPDALIRRARALLTRSK